MGSLGDAFPEHFRAESAGRQIRQGAVLRTWVKDTKPPKTKRWVVVADTGDMLLLGLVYLNTEINPNIFPTEDMRRLYVLMEPDERQLVDHKCYADCSRLHEMPRERAQHLLTDDPDCLLGHLENHELGHLQRVAAGARTISPRDKKRFGLS